MFHKKLRRYRVHGRTTHSKFNHEHDRQHKSQPTELLVSAFEQFPEYPSALRLDFGHQDRDGGWIKLPENSLRRIQETLTDPTEPRDMVCRHEGVCIDVQPNPDLQHGVGDVRDVVLELSQINCKTGEPGCELTLGVHETAGANIILTPAQTTDFIDIIETRLKKDFKHVIADTPVIISPDGEKT